MRYVTLTIPAAMIMAFVGLLLFYFSAEEVSGGYCPAGSYGTKKTGCNKCPAGTYAWKKSITKRKGCKKCPKGKTSVAGSHRKKSCAPPRSTQTFAFIATADPQYNYWTSRRYDQQANQTLCEVRKYMDANKLSLVTIAGDLHFDAGGANDYKKVYQSFLQSGHTIVDVMGNHDKFVVGKSTWGAKSRTYLKKSKVNKQQKTREVAYSEWHDKKAHASMNDDYSGALYYAHEVSALGGKLYIVALGEHSSISDGFMKRFMDASAGIVRKGDRRRYKRYNPDYPIIIVKHRGNKIQPKGSKFPYEEGFRLSKDMISAIRGKPVLGFLYGHQHCDSKGRRVANTDGSPGSISGSKKYCFDNWQSYSDLKNSWGTNIKYLNVAAAHLGVYWVITVAKTGGGYALGAGKRTASRLCYDQAPRNDKCNYHPFRKCK